MEKKQPTNKDFISLKKRTEQKINSVLEKLNTLPDDLVKETERLLHKLQVHQIELEMQNDKLLKSQIELKKSEQKYIDLFDFAPVGYLTLDENGKIITANLTVAKQLDADRGKLINKTFFDFFYKKDKSLLYLHLNKVFETKTLQLFETKIRRNDESEFFALIKSTSINDSINNLSQCRTVITDITSRKEAERLLSESEEKFKTLFENAVDGILIADAETKTFIEGNNAICQMLGYNKEEINELWINDIHPAKDLTFATDNFERQFKEELRFFKTMSVKRKNGSIFFAEVTSFPITVNEKKYLIGVFRDITERKHMEDELQETRERLELAMDAGEHGFWDWNLDTNEIYFSPRYYTMLGYESGELPMKLETWVNLMHPEDKKTIVPRVEKYVRNAEAYEVEFRLKTKQGNWKWISGRGKSYKKNINGIPHRALGVHVDITERKQVEEAVKESEEKYRDLANNSITPIVIHNIDGKIKYVNDRAVEIIRAKSANEIYALSTNLFILSDVVGKNKKKIESLFVHGNITKIDQKLLCLDGETIDVELWAVKTIFEGEPCIQITFNDITAHRQAEEALHESEVRFRELFQNMNNGVAVYEETNGGTDFIFTDFNKAAERIDNIKKEQLIGKSVLEVFPNAKEFGYLDAFQRVWMTGKAEQLPTTTYKDDRIQGWRENYVYKLQSGEIVAIYEDITERKKAEDALRVSEMRLKEANKIVLLGNWELDISNSQLKWSEGVFDMFEIDSNNFGVTYEAFLDVIHPNDRNRVNAAYTESLKSKTPYEITHRLLMSDGRIKWVIEKCRTDYDEQGKPIRSFGIVQDITKQKETEERISKSLKEKEILLREVHHRVKNNMQIISSLLSIQSRKTDNSEAIEILEDSQARVKAMSIVHETLYHSESLAEIDIQKYIERLLSGLIVTLTKPRKKIDFKIDAKNIFLNIEKAIPFGLVLNELITNVYKHSFKDEVNCKVLIEIKEQENGKINMVFSDNGVGISKDIQIKNNTTFGLQLIYDLVVSQLLGNIELIRDKGTKYLIDFSR